ncbi:MAG: PH domain-containing protein [Clostridia bacterium]|nr:PH domain-containing protein [Clostridia bacterium]
MINFNRDSVFNLKPIEKEEIRPEVSLMLTEGEEFVQAFKTIRDQLLFTNKRIIAVNVQGVTGTRVSYTSLPYSKVQYFTVQTPGLLEIVSDSELILDFSDGFRAVFEVRGDCDISKIGRMIADYTL